MSGRKPRFNLSWKIILFTMIPFLMVLIALCAMTIDEKSQNERDLLSNRIDSYVALLESGDLSFESVQQKEKLENVFDEIVISSELIGRDRRVVYSAGTTEYDVDKKLIDSAYNGSIVTYTMHGEQSVLVSLYPIVVRDVVVGVLHLELSYEKTDNKIMSYTIFILLISLSGLVVSFIMVMFLSDRIVIRRIEELNRMSYEIGKGNMHHRICDRSNDELGTLASAFNNMGEELENEKDRVLGINGDLMRSNTDLEQFAYVSSHDLQEPLRMISGYVDLIKRKYKGALDSDMDKYIEFIVGGVNRMQLLIDDLLKYSRVSTLASPLVLINCENILEDSLLNLKISINESGAVVTHDPLPTVMADGSQLTQVFQNLISNAIKFKGSEPPRIHIGVEKKEEMWVFSVADNGIGIAPEFFDRIFVVFNRLHSSEKYSGTGIGLSICKKIVERYGGKIWVDSKIGRGSKFYFTISYT